MARTTRLDEPRIAVFIDFENVALGLQQAKMEKFRLDLVLNRLVEKGKIIFMRAYADWTRYRAEKESFHQASVELLDLPKKRKTGKNAADIRMVVDALDLCYTRRHVDTVALVTGDSDFTPLVAKLAQYDKYVIGLGVKNSTAELLVNICDEFIYYDDLVGEATEALRKPMHGIPKKELEFFELLNGSIAALMREGHDVIWGSMVKQQLKRKRPSFSERAHGFRSFSEALEAAGKAGLIKLERVERSGGYMITAVAGDEGEPAKPPK